MEKLLLFSIKKRRQTEIENQKIDQDFLKT